MGFAWGLGSGYGGSKTLLNSLLEGSHGNLRGKRSPSWLTGTPGKIDKTDDLVFKTEIKLPSNIPQDSCLLWNIMRKREPPKLLFIFMTIGEMWLLQIPVVGFMDITESQCMHILWNDTYTKSGLFHNCTNSKCAGKTSCRMWLSHHCRVAPPGLTNRNISCSCTELRGWSFSRAISTCTQR